MNYKEKVMDIAEEIFHHKIAMGEISMDNISDLAKARVLHNDINFDDLNDDTKSEIMLKAVEEHDADHSDYLCECARERQIEALMED